VAVGSAILRGPERDRMNECVGVSRTSHDGEGEVAQMLRFGSDANDERHPPASGLSRRDVLAQGGRLAAAATVLPAFQPLGDDARALADPRLRALDRAVRGPILTPASPDYEAAREPTNARYDDVRPLAVVQPLDAADIRAVVRWSARTGVHIAARSGGHSYGGYSTTRGVVIDLSRMGGISVNRSDEAVIGAGARLFDIYSRLASRGLAIPGGVCPTVGIGGLALGGGHGLATRAWGLTCDSVRELDIVTADGRLLRCDRRRHRDLFWACRGGGGGNFGIVTRFVFRTRRIRGGAYFMSTWPWDAAEMVMGRYQEWAPEAPDALTTLCTLGTGPTTPNIQVYGQFLGSEDRLRRVLRGLTRDAAPTSLTTGTATWLDLQLRWARCLETPEDCRRFPSASFVGASDYAERSLPTAGITMIRRIIEERQELTGAASLLIDAYGGAVNRVPPSATAFVHRTKRLALSYTAPWQSPDGAAASRAWRRRLHRALRPYASGSYQNYIDPELRDWQRAYYGANLARLVEVKRRHDPDNLFRFAQSIPTR